MMPTESVTAPRVPFWQRQFAPEATWGQIAFDVAVGVLLPVVCLVFDPIVFRGASFGAPVLAQYALLAYVSIGIALLVLAFWLLCQRSAALLAGSLFAGALFALLLGLVLFPLSLIGVFMSGIGVLGFSPFLTAFVFWRNGVRALAQVRQKTMGAIALIAAGFLAMTACPLVAQSYVDGEIARGTELAMSLEPTEAARGIDKLRTWRLVADFDRLVWKFEAEKDTARRERLAAAYKEVTDTDIEHRLAVLRD